MTKEESLAWAKLLQAQGEGKQLQVVGSYGVWRDLHLEDRFVINSCSKSWRIKPEQVLKPWKLDQKYLGTKLKHKEIDKCFSCITGVSGGYFFAGHMGAYTPNQLLDCWTLLDGSPCGEME